MSCSNYSRKRLINQLIDGNFSNGMNGHFFLNIHNTVCEYSKEDMARTFLVHLYVCKKLSMIEVEMFNVEGKSEFIFSYVKILTW